MVELLLSLLLTGALRQGQHPVYVTYFVTKAGVTDVPLVPGWQRTVEDRLKKEGSTSYIAEGVFVGPKPLFPMSGLKEITFSRYDTLVGVLKPTPNPFEGPASEPPASLPLLVRDATRKLGIFYEVESVVMLVYRSGDSPEAAASRALADIRANRFPWEGVVARLIVGTDTHYVLNPPTANVAVKDTFPSPRTKPRGKGKQ